MKTQLYFYFFKISELLTCPAREKRRILKLIKNNVKIFVWEHSGCTAQNVMDYFGTPEEIAYSYLKQLDVSAWKGNFSLSGLLIRSSALTFFILAILITLFFLALFFTCNFAPSVPVYSYPGPVLNFINVLF